jgi:hypothetical protein
VQRLIPYESWRDLEFVVADSDIKDLIRCLSEDSIGITNNESLLYR